MQRETPPLTSFSSHRAGILAFQINLLFDLACFLNQLAFQIHLLSKSICFPNPFAFRIHLLSKSTCFPNPIACQPCCFAALLLSSLVAIQPCCYYPALLLFSLLAIQLSFLSGGMLRAKPYLLFSTSTKENFRWPEGFTYALDNEVEDLRRECRWALWSLNAECLRRNKTRPKGLLDSKFAEIIEANVVNIEKKTLSLNQKGLIVRSRSFLRGLDSSIASAWQDKAMKRMCKELCWQVLTWTTRDLALLLVSSFGRMKLGCFGEQEAVQAVEYLYKHREDLTRRVHGLFEPKEITNGVQNSKQCVLGIYQL